MVPFAVTTLLCLGSASDEEEAMVRMLTLQQRALVSNSPLPLRPLPGAAELPSGGDCSYPGFVALDESRGLLSYYSSHDGSTSIYLAEIVLS